MSEWHFHDLHAFKDFLGFVMLCSPNLYPPREGAGPDEQWTLDLAFEGLRHGMEIAENETGNLASLGEGRFFIDEAYKEYKRGNVPEGYRALEKVEKILKKIRTH